MIVGLNVLSKSTTFSNIGKDELELDKDRQPGFLAAGRKTYPVRRAEIDADSSGS